MARKRVELDKNFVSDVTIAANGGTTGSVRKYRARYTTLQEIAEEIITEAKMISDMPANPRRDRGGLPSSTMGGRRNLQYPFRRSGPPGTRTYRSSFKSSIEKVNGRLTVLVENTHPHADEVEFGLDRKTGSVIKAKNSYMKVPLTQAAYRKMNKPLSSKRRSELYYANKDKNKPKRGSFNPLANLRGGAARTVGRKRTTSVKSFPGIATTGAYKGKPVLFTRSVQAYGGYGILKRAMKTVASKYF